MIWYQSDQSGNDAAPAKLNLQGVGPLAATAQATVLSSPSLADKQPDQPKKVAPTETTISNVGQNFSHEFPARSLTVLG